MSLVDECSNWLLSNRHAVITRFERHTEVTIGSSRGMATDLRRWVSYDPTDNLMGIVTVDTRVKAGILGDMMVIENTDTLPLGFSFIIRAESASTPFELVQQRADGSLWRINDDGTVYSQPTMVYIGDVWRLTLVHNRRNERTEWIGHRITGY